MVKLDLDSDYWDLYDEKIPGLLQLYSQNIRAYTDEFDEIRDYIWDAGACERPFYAVIPHMIYFASNVDFEIAKELWSNIGIWVSRQEKFRTGVPDEILSIFDHSLRYAEKKCAELLVKQNQIAHDEARYLFPTLFSFSKHAFGYMALGSYKDEPEGIDVATCSQGHEDEFTIFNTGIVPYGVVEESHIIIPVGSKDFEYPFEKSHDTTWSDFLDTIDNKISSNIIPENILSHLKLARIILENGVTPNLPMRFAFSLCGSLLYCQSTEDLANRMFHGWDMVKCTICGEKYQFCDHWSGYDY